jgi:hypothetical protein
MANKLEFVIVGKDQFSDALGRIKSSLPSIRTLGFAAAAGVAALGATLTKATMAANVQEKAEKTLETALGKTSQRLLDQAAALQKVTTFGDEQIISAQALIGSFVKEESQIEAATKATLDLAAAKGFDLTAAADLVSKTLGSSTNALSRYGIQVEGAVGSTERLNSLTENLAAVFGGQATAQAETFGGKMQQVSNIIGDTFEQVGFLITKNEAFLKGLDSIGKWIVDNTPAIVGFFETWFLGLGKLGSIFGRVLASIFEGLDFLVEKFRGTLEAINIGGIFDGALEALETYELGVESAIQTFSNFADSSSEFSNRIIENYIGIRDASKESTDSQIEDITKLQEAQAQAEVTRLQLAEEEFAASEQRFADEETIRFARIQAEWDEAAQKKAVEEAKANFVKTGAKTINTVQQALFAASGKRSKALFALNKAIAVKDVIVDTAKSVSRALSNPPGIPFSIPQGIFAAAQGALQLATIKGQAHDGLTNVPSEGTFLLDRGERVVSAEQNRDLTDALRNGGSPSGEVNIKIDVLPNATNADALLNMDEQDWLEITESRIVPALRQVTTAGVVI